MEFLHFLRSSQDFDWRILNAAGTIDLIGGPFVMSCICFIKTNIGISNMDY